MALKYAYLGSTQVSKEILKQLPIEPSMIISYTEEYRDQISGCATYEDFAGWERVDSINSDQSKSLLRQSDPDIVLVMAWQELLDPEVLEIPTHGCVGRHLSLLPKRRGRAPVAWALIHGLDKTGVTLFWLDEGVDSGDIIAQRTVEITPADEAQDLHDKMTDASVELLCDVIPEFENESFPRTPQDDDQATYTHPRRPDMGLIDWTQSAARLHDFIRGQTHPYPGAFTYHKLDRVRVWHASINHQTASRAAPGTVIESPNSDVFVIQTGEGLLEIEVENEHGNHPISIDSVLGCLPDGR